MYLDPVLGPRRRRQSSPRRVIILLVLILAGLVLLSRRERIASLSCPRRRPRRVPSSMRSRHWRPTMMGTYTDLSTFIVRRLGWRQMTRRIAYRSHGC